MKIKLHTIGKGSPCLVISEIGMNHNGSIDNAKKLIDAGANVLVSGSTIFKQNSGDLKKNISLLRSS